MRLNNCKMSHHTCMTLCNVTSLKNAVFARRETPEFILPLPWPPNSPGLNPVDCNVWGMQQQKFTNRVTDLDDLKHCIRTEWIKLDHAVIAAAVHQWHRRLSVSVNAGGGHFEHCVWFRHSDCVFSDNYDFSYCRWSVEHLHANS